MQSKEEIILEVFRQHSFEAAVVGACTVIVPEDEWCRVAEQILSLPELKDELQPQLPQAPCSTLRDSIVQKMKEVAEATPVHNDEFTEYERNLELEHLRIALQVIDELQPVA